MPTPKVGDTVRLKDQHQHGRVVKIEGDHADVNWPRLKSTILGANGSPI